MPASGIEKGNLMKQGENRISVWSIAAVFVGSLTGAGFASGREILQFFGVFHEYGFFGLIIAIVLLIFFGFIIMYLGYALQSGAYADIIVPYAGKTIKTAVEGVITISLFCTFTAMIAAAGAVFRQQFGIPSLVGSFVACIVAVFTVMKGLNVVIKSFSRIVPVLLFSAIGVSILSMIIVPADAKAVHSIALSPLVGNWLLSPLLYIACCLLSSSAILGLLGMKAGKQATVRGGAVLGGLCFGAGAAAIYFALVRNLENAAAFDLPMMYLAGRIFPGLMLFYAITLLLGIYVTSVSCLFAASFRISSIKGLNSRVIIPAAAFMAFLASTFGFADIIGYLYPIEGYVGMVVLACLLYSFIRLLSSRRSKRERKDSGYSGVV